MTTHSLKDKVVLITGGAKNLGGLISRKFAEQGAKLAIHYIVKLLYYSYKIRKKLEITHRLSRSTILYAYV